MELHETELETCVMQRYETPMRQADLPMTLISLLEILLAASVQILPE
jgi:hypothetical protein